MAAKKFFQKYDYDIAFDEDVGTNLIAWNTGLMVFFVTLTLAVNLALSSLSKNWMDTLAGSLTIEVKPPITSVEKNATDHQIEKDFSNKIKEILAFLRDTPGVADTRLLPDSEVRDLIEPWIGDNTALETLVLPTLIDVKKGVGLDLDKLKADLTNIEPSASVDTHSDTIKDIEKVMNTARAFVSLLTALIIFLATVSISGIIRSKLLIHRHEVETLHLIGAGNEYIARQFRQHTLHNTIKGAVTGVIFTVVTLVTISIATDTLESGLVTYVKVMPIEWFLLVIGPVVVGSLIAHLTAQAAALRELSKLV